MTTVYGKLVLTWYFSQDRLQRMDMDSISNQSDHWKRLNLNLQHKHQETEYKLVIKSNKNRLPRSQMEVPPQIPDPSLPLQHPPELPPGILEEHESAD